MAIRKTIKVYTKKGKVILIDATKENSPEYLHLQKSKPVKTKRTPKKPAASNPTAQLEDTSDGTDS